LPFSDEPLSVYTGRVDLAVPVTFPAPGRHDLALAVRLQACDDRRCLPPATVTLKLPIKVR